MRLYMIVSRDEYELPEAVSDSIVELAVMTKRTTESLRACFCRGRQKDKKNYKHYRHYITLDIDD